jgi:YHS domain-containing protein
MRAWFGFVLVAGCVCCLISLSSEPVRLTADERKPQNQEPKSASKTALAELNSLIGGWRGVGQLKRGSAEGSWRENAEWVWDFKQDDVAIRYEIPDGKLLLTARLVYLPTEKKYGLIASFADKTSREYHGQLDGKRLVLESAADDMDFVHRLTVTLLNDKRSLVLHEKRRADSGFFIRVAEVGYTREGTRLAASDVAGPECIVTGGAGTMKVEHKGQAYYVCCSGCRDAFLDDPEGVIADAKRRAEAEKKKREASTSK